MLAVMGNRDVIKRAFEIAPECGSLTEVKLQLSREGYPRVHVEAHFSGQLTKREIRAQLKPKP